MVEAIGYIKASDTHGHALFGQSIAISGDGETLVVGAPRDSYAADIPPGAIYVFVRADAQWSQQVQLDAPDSDIHGLFGSSLSLSDDGNLLVASAPGVNGDQGKVYTFSRSGATWTQEPPLVASNADAKDLFGAIVALSRNGAILAIGAPGEDSGAIGVHESPLEDNDVCDSGATYVFVWTDEGWSLDAFIKAPKRGGDVRFGAALALSGEGTTLAVGAPGDGGSTTCWIDDETSHGHAEPGAGAVYVYSRANSTWIPPVYLSASNRAAEDEFGSSVALSWDGATLVVGAPKDGGVAEIDSPDHDGSVYAFVLAGDKWIEEAYIRGISLVSWKQEFGTSVALSADGSILAVGAPYDNGSAVGVDGASGEFFSDAGSVYVFQRTDGAWRQRSYVKPSNTWLYFQFGSSVTLSGDGSNLAVGAPCEDGISEGVGGSQFNAGLTCSGATYLY